MHGLLRRLNPKSMTVNVIKIGGGLYAYKLINTNIEIKWQRWAMYAGLALCGLWAPLAQGAISTLIPDIDN